MDFDYAEVCSYLEENPKKKSDPRNFTPASNTCGTLYVGIWHIRVFHALCL